MDGQADPTKLDQKLRENDKQFTEATTALTTAVQQYKNIIQGQQQEIQTLKVCVSNSPLHTSAKFCKGESQALRLGIQPQLQEGNNDAGLKAELSKLKGELQEKNREIGKKDMLIQQNIEKIHRIQGAAACGAHIQGYSASFSSDGISDSEVIQRFKALKDTITGLAWRNFPGAPFIKPTKSMTNHRNIFETLTDDFEAYLLKNGKGKAAFFEAVIWYKLIDSLLDNPVQRFHDIGEAEIKRLIDINIEGMWAIYPRTQSSLFIVLNLCVLRIARPDSMEEWSQKYHAARVAMVDFFDEAYGNKTPWDVGGSSRKQLVNELVELLSRYHNCNTDEDIEARRNFKRDLDPVVDHAASLAFVLAKSKALWRCCMFNNFTQKTRHDFPLSKESMKVVHAFPLDLDLNGQKNQVYLVARPSLLKYGTGKGEGYGDFVVKEPAGVVVRSNTRPKIIKEDPDAAYEEV